MDNMWDKIKKGLKEGAAISMEKIEEYTKIGKLKIDELAAKRKIDKHLVDIGQRVVDMVDEGKTSGIAGDAVVAKAVAGVKELKQELAVIADKIAKVQEEARKAHADRTAGDEEEPAGV